MNRGNSLSTWQELYCEAAAALREAGVENPGMESEILISELGKFRRSELFFRKNAEVAPETAALIREGIARRSGHEPLQYVTGTAPFREVELQVSPGVLIPRPETELLVGEVLRKLPRGGSLADIGTGSGAIALSAAYEREDITVVAVDSSAAALEIAAANRRRLNLWGRVELRQGDLTAPLQSRGEYYDVAAANLPYISESDFASCPAEVRDHEPREALVAPENGLALIFRLIHEAMTILKPSGWLILEIGCTQGGAVTRALGDAAYRNIEVKRDLTGRVRFAMGQKAASPSAAGGTPR